MKRTNSESGKIRNNPGWDTVTRKLRASPLYADLSFKRLSGIYLDSVIKDNSVVQVSLEVFVSRDLRVPLFLGTQFGLHPRLKDIGPLQDGKIAAILCKSVLSGLISGVKFCSYDLAEGRFLELDFVGNR